MAIENNPKDPDRLVELANMALVYAIPAAVGMLAWRIFGCKGYRAESYMCSEPFKYSVILAAVIIVAGALFIKKSRTK